MTDQPPLHEQVRELERQRDRYRDHVPDGYFHFMDVHFAEDRGFPEAPAEGDKHTARDGSEWHYDGAKWELHTYAPDPVKLIEQVRTLEADLVMCREQLAQESERAEEAVKEATSPGSPLVQQADTYRRILAHSAIYTHTCISPGRGSMSDQIIARLDELAAAESERDEWRDRAHQSTDYEQQHGVQLPTPDATNPAHLRWAAEVITALMGSSSILVSMSFVHTEADRLEAAQQQPDTCADTEPDSRVRCQGPKGHLGDHCYEDDYGNGIAWTQDVPDADEELIKKAARVDVLWPNRATELIGPVRAKALHAANLLRDGGEK